MEISFVQRHRETAPARTPKQRHNGRSLPFDSRSHSNTVDAEPKEEFDDGGVLTKQKGKPEMICRGCKVKMREMKRSYHKRRKWICPRCGRAKMQQPKPKGRERF